MRACFAAETHLLTPEGSKAIEAFKEGDFVVSRDENDPQGMLFAKRVEEVFVRTGRILEIRVRGRIISTTPEHPFFVANRGGWVDAGELVAGDVLLGADRELVVVEAVDDTGRYETVYNLRVADFHTYFIGDVAWGWSVWAHIAYEAFRARFGSDVLSEEVALFAFNRNVPNGNRANFIRYLRNRSNLTLE